MTQMSSAILYIALVLAAGTAIKDDGDDVTCLLQRLPGQLVSPTSRVRQMSVSRVQSSEMWSAEKPYEAQPLNRPLPATQFDRLASTEENAFKHVEVWSGEKPDYGLPLPYPAEEGLDPAIGKQPAWIKYSFGKGWYTPPNPFKWGMDHFEPWLNGISTSIPPWNEGEWTHWLNNTDSAHDPLYTQNASGQLRVPHITRHGISQPVDWANGSWTRYQNKDWSFPSSTDNSGTASTLRGPVEEANVSVAGATGASTPSLFATLMTAPWSLYSAADWSSPFASAAMPAPLPAAAAPVATALAAPVAAAPVAVAAPVATAPAAPAGTAPVAAVAPETTPYPLPDYTAPPIATQNWPAPPIATQDWTAPAVAGVAYTPPPVATADYTAPPIATAEYTAPPIATAEYTAPPPANVEYTAPPAATADWTAPPPAMQDYTPPPNPAMNDYSVGSWNQYSQKDWNDIPSAYKQPAAASYKPSQATGNYAPNEQSWYAPADPIKNYAQNQDGGQWTQYQNRDWRIGDSSAGPGNNGNFKKYETFGKWDAPFGKGKVCCSGSTGVSWEMPFGKGAYAKSKGPFYKGR